MSGLDLPASTYGSAFGGECLLRSHTSLKTRIEEEEEEIFPRIGKVWDEARLNDAGAKMEQMKSKKAAAA